MVLSIGQFKRVWEGFGVLSILSPVYECFTLVWFNPLCCFPSGLPRAIDSRQYLKPAHNPRLFWPCAKIQQPARPYRIRVYRVLGKVLGNYFNKTLDTLVSTPQTLP
jgi:hypothetical protein